MPNETVPGPDPVPDAVRKTSKVLQELSDLQRKRVLEALALIFATHKIS